MNWLDIVSKIMERDEDKIQLAPLSNISGADIKFDKGYGTLKINVPSDVADNLTNGSCKYMGGLLLIDRQTYKDMEKQINEIPTEHWTVTENGCVITCPKCGERLELCYPDGTEVRYLPHCPWCGKKLEEGE